MHEQLIYPPIKRCRVPVSFSSTPSGFLLGLCSILVSLPYDAFTCPPQRFHLHFQHKISILLLADGGQCEFFELGAMPFSQQLHVGELVLAFIISRLLSSRVQTFGQWPFLKGPILVMELTPVFQHLLLRITISITGISSRQMLSTDSILF